MPPDDEDRASLVDMLGFAREVVQFSRGRKRNVIAHEYGRVDLDEIWKTAERDAPRLVSALEAIVAALPPPR